MTENQRIEREVRSEDPSLSPEANRLLTEELQEVVGAERVEMPAGTSDPGRERRGSAGAVRTTLIANRIWLIPLALILVITGTVVALTTGEWWTLAIPVVLVAAALVIVLTMALQLASQSEHADPSRAAQLEEEGVPDPDRALTDLVEQFAEGRDPSGAREEVSGEENVRTSSATDDPAKAAVEDRTANTPTSAPSSPAGP